MLETNDLRLVSNLIRRRSSFHISRFVFKFNARLIIRIGLAFYSSSTSFILFYSVFHRQTKEIKSSAFGRRLTCDAWIMESKWIFHYFKLVSTINSLFTSSRSLASLTLKSCSNSFSFYSLSRKLIDFDRKAQLTRMTSSRNAGNAIDTIHHDDWRSTELWKQTNWELFWYAKEEAKESSLESFDFVEAQLNEDESMGKERWEEIRWRKWSAIKQVENHFLDAFVCVMKSDPLRSPPKIIKENEKTRIRKRTKNNTSTFIDQCDRFIICVAVRSRHSSPSPVCVCVFAGMSACN